MRNFKMPRGTVGGFTEVAGKILVYALVTAIPYMLTKNTSETKFDHILIGYDDVVESIMKSTMFSDDKIEAVATIPKDASIGLYKAIIHVVESKMFSCDKVEAIQKICKK